jgi:tight adherence protein C
MSSAPLLAGLTAGLAVALGSFALIAALVRRADARNAPRRVAAKTRNALALKRLLEQIRIAAPRIVSAAGSRKLESTIAQAGLSGTVRPRDVAAARVLTTAIAAIAIPRLATVLPPRMLIIVLPIWCFAAAELPLWWLRRRGQRRTAALLQSLPDALDLLRACLAAGLPLRRALLLVGDHCAEPVATEFTCVAAETALGVSQATALDGLAARNPIAEIRALVNSMHQADRHGSPLAPVIAAQAEAARLALNRSIIERGARAGPKIQLIVSMTIVPGAMLGMAAAVIAAIARGDLKFL